MRRKHAMFIIGAVLALLTTVPLLFAAGQTEARPDNEYGEFVEFTFYSAQVAVPADDNRTLMHVEDKFNVDIQYDAAPWGDYANALATRLAAGDTPDWFYVQGGSRPPLFDELVADGIALELGGRLDDYPYLDAYVNEEHPEIMALWGEQDGSLYAIPPFFGYQRHAPLYRKDLFDQLGLGVPDTWDEYKESLRTVMEADPEGTEPFGVSVFTAVLLENSIPAYTGTADSWYDKNGEWIYRAFDPGFKEWLAFWEGMYDDGILDPEWNLLTAADVASKWASGRIVATFNHINTVNWNRFNDPLISARPGAEMALMVPYPAGPAGRYWVRNDGFFLANVINRNADEAVIERMLTIMDWNHSPEGEMVSTYGLEGVHYTLDSSGDVIRDMEETNKDAVSPGGEQYVMYMGANFALRDNIEIPQIRRNGEALAEYGISTVVRIDVPVEERDAWQDVNARFDETNQDWYLSFLTGERSVDDDYEAYLSALRQAGYAEMQNFYERFGYEIEIE